MRMLVSNLNAAMMSGRKLYGKSVTSLDALFDTIDRDSGGTIDTEELELALRRLGLGLKPAQIHDLMTFFEADPVSGEIPREEFVKVMTREMATLKAVPWRRAKSPRREKEQLGVQINANVKGLANKDRENVLKMLVSALNAAFMQGRKLYGQKINSVDEFFDAVDKDGGGSVDREELSGALRRLGLGLKPSHIDTLMQANVLP